MTNADKIRAMSNEELAKFLYEFIVEDNDWKHCQRDANCESGIGCSPCYKQWLESEAKE